MYVGVIYNFGVYGAFVMSIPHVCGGDPLVPPESDDYDPYSPCMWG